MAVYKNCSVLSDCKCIFLFDPFAVRLVEYVGTAGLKHTVLTRAVSLLDTNRYISLKKNGNIHKQI